MRLPRLVPLLIASVLLVACKPSQTPAPDTPAAPAPQPATETPVPAAPATPEPLPEPVVDTTAGAFRALGTEPFWHVDVDGGALVYKTPEDQVGQMMTGTRVLQADGVDIVGEHAGQPFKLSLRNGSCSDGMSDQEFSMTARFEVQGRSLSGCARSAN